MHSLPKCSILVLLISFALLFNSCEKDENKSSLCVITKPESETVFSIGEIVEIKVDANYSEGNKRARGLTFREVRLFVNNEGVASTSEFPYTFLLNTSDFSPGMYDIKAIATFNEGLQAADVTQIEMIAGVPAVETLDAIDIEVFTAIVGGIIHSSGGEEILESGFYWDTLPHPETNGKKIKIASVNNRLLTTLTGLPSGKIISYRAFANNVNGEGLGVEMTFITAGDGMTPTCYIISPDDNTLVGRGEIVNIRVEATDPDGNNLEVRLFVNDEGVTSTTQFPYTINWATEDYEPGNYVVKIVATDNQGLSSSDTRNITIGVREPIVETANATEVALTSGRIGGKILSSGGSPVTEAGAYWGYDPDPELNGTKISGQINGDEFSLGLTGLSTNTDIYYKAYAVNAIGESTGEVKAFKTLGNQIGTFVDPRDNKTYKWVFVGSQMWMAENLAYLPAVSPPDVGSSEDNHYYVYGYSGTNVSEAKATANYGLYGVLYNWEAAVDACPAGWHVPDDEEWKQLERTLGMSVLDSDNAGWRGTYEGRYLKSKQGWFDNGNGNNVSDFNGIPGGFRLSQEVFDFEGKYANWWTSTDFSSTNAWYRSLYYNNSGVFRNNAPSNQGFSVRCLKD